VGELRHQGRDELIRLAGSDDSAALLALQQRLDRQSAFMLVEPDERDATPARLRERLASQSAHGAFDLVADDPDLPGPALRLAGWLAVDVLPYRRAAHVGYVVLGVDSSYAGRGIGRALLDVCAEEATRRGLRRLELTVMTDNLRALGLYLRHGFEVEGLRRRAVLRSGELVDEYFMGRLLDPRT
jgi:ribosomal protein S18 acetylase RimI-like enzyme